MISICRSRESLDGDRDGAAFENTSNLNSNKQFNSTLAIPQNCYNPSDNGNSPYYPSQNSRSTHSICQSSTPKISNNAESMKHSGVFPSEEVSPVVLRNNSRSLRNNMVQNHPNHFGNPSYHNNFSSNTNLTKQSILITPSSSMLNIKHYTDCNGSGVEGIRYCGVNTDGVIMNPVLLHHEQMRKTNENDTKRNRQSVPAMWGYSSPKHSNSTTPTNFDSYLSRNNHLHESMGNNRFSVSRKASPTIDYNNQNGTYPPNYNNQNNLDHTNIPMIVEPPQNEYGVHRRISPQDQLLWTNGLKVPNVNGDQKRKISSPAMLGGISMDNIGATGNSIYLRHGTSFNCLNMVLNNFASPFIKTFANDDIDELTFLCMK